MDDQTRHALHHDRTVDITTIGRTSGLPRRIETWLFHVDAQIYLSGSPGRRDWYANLLDNPDFTIHLKQRVVADVPAHATPIVAPDTRRAVFSRILADLRQPDDLDAWLAGSPLVAVRPSPE